jgi:hypothetical protein
MPDGEHFFNPLIQWIGGAVKRAIVVLIAVAALGSVASIMVRSAYADGQVPVFVTQMPPGYRDWKVISVAHEEGNLKSLGAVLGNDVAIKAYRDGKLPFPDGAIIAALHYSHTPSEENNKVFGHDQSFVPGKPTNTQVMVKDSTKYAATGGWGFAHFNSDGKPADAAVMNSCFPCHQAARVTDFVFTHYAP